MLVRMLPGQVEDAWEGLAPLIEKSLPDSAGRGVVVMTNVLRALLESEALLWLWYNGEAEFLRGEYSVLLLTTEVTDNVAGSRTMLIYSFSAVQPNVTRDMWHVGFETLVKYARARGCRAITAYTENERLLHMLTQFGWDDSTSFLTYSLR